MKLDYLTVKNITCGAVDVSKDVNGYLFYRFTVEQTEFYKNRNDAHYSLCKKCFKKM